MSASYVAPEEDRARIATTTARCHMQLTACGHVLVRLIAFELLTGTLRVRLLHTARPPLPPQYRRNRQLLCASIRRMYRNGGQLQRSYAKR